MSISPPPSPNFPEAGIEVWPLIIDVFLYYKWYPAMTTPYLPTIPVFLGLSSIHRSRLYLSDSRLSNSISRCVSRVYSLVYSDFFLYFPGFPCLGISTEGHNTENITFAHVGMYVVRVWCIIFAERLTCTIWMSVYLQDMAKHDCRWIALYVVYGQLSH